MMERIKQGARWGFSGKAGSVIGSSWKNIEYSKDEPKTSKKHQLQRQLEQLFALICIHLHIDGNTLRRMNQVPKPADEIIWERAENIKRKAESPAPASFSPSQTTSNSQLQFDQSGNWQHATGISFSPSQATGNTQHLKATRSLLLPGSPRTQ